MPQSPDAPHLTPDEAMDLAVLLAAQGPVTGPNPQVGCVLTDDQGVVLARGWHRGAGTPHAEVAALDDARRRGIDITGATAFVTLEPCNHTGRTGPCATALADAGIGRVQYAVPDPGEASAGGAATLNDAGIPAMYAPHEGASTLTRRWHHAMSHGRPYVIAKWASTLDGRMAAADGTAFWITGEQARAHAHEVRAAVDAIAVGTGTVATDDPQLSARPPGSTSPHQPLRVVIGNRSTTGAQVWRDDNAIAIASHEPDEILAVLHSREIRTVIVEGGPTVLSAFIAAGVVDEVHAYIAPAILGDGPTAVSGVGITTMSGALRLSEVTSTPLGADTLVTGLVTEGT
ncbi:bifunctional diaminohydroxyphosphoribosylaminopyrimidine deaminase/5-amino-6-(5-phosphoribosylamino)uracil reductase RibD [Demequina sediminicola]|uniref:bifunctional diaminohydroxyphosphoribosylaminopyrimidine deaminase/5-amino-6-(5-phosphoribosylamino)uracil reductase RibD n=1 Tax=Demequina sediminicola TaxID=1095026 RepID=UPI000780EFA2|nr:bifunctional diaminohydroxyphosphoribosylaminopyrimidine deaminase/5-amino-6-(5-phosphoribosylamino)uracil reductase RibD [Demequina sediminicola]